MQLCVSSSYLVSEFSFGQNLGSFCHLIKSPKLLPRLRCPQGYNQVSGFIYQAPGVYEVISLWNFVTVFAISLHSAVCCVCAQILA